MKTHRALLSTCGQATGTVVVIDVLRAFSTAAYAFGAGAEKLLLVSTVEAAFDLRNRFPGALLTGEVNGELIPGFDFGNSPSEISQVDLTGITLIQRTSAGTQGVVRSRNAGRLLAASFCVARATADALRQANSREVTFVNTAGEQEGGGDEDAACADYLEALLVQEVDPAPYLERVRQSANGQSFCEPDKPPVLQVDLEYCLQVNKFDFTLQVERVDGLLVMSCRR